MNDPYQEFSAPSPEPPPFTPLAILMLMLMTTLLGALAGSGIAYLLLLPSGHDMQSLVQGFNQNSPLQDRNLLRLATLANHIFTFAIPAIFVSFLVFKYAWFRSLKLDERPMLKTTVWGVLFILTAFPLAQAAFWLNKQLPLPEALRAVEDTTESLLRGFLVMNSPVEFLFNLLVIAIIPAIGEELVFRGVVQQTLERWLRNPLAAVWVGAGIFSFFHFQFEGFLPRLILGAVLGYLFLWSRNLWVPIAGHFFNNGLQVLIAYLLPEQVEKMETQEMDPAQWGVAGVALLLTIWIARHFKKMGETSSPLS